MTDSSAQYRNTRMLSTRIVRSILSLSILLPTFRPILENLTAAAVSSGAAATGIGSTSVHATTNDVVQPPGINDGDDGDGKGDNEGNDDGDDESGEDSDENYEDVDYEIKIRQALSRYAAEYPLLVERSVREGEAVEAAEVVPDGSVVGIGGGDDDNVEEELWQVEFALEALERERKALKVLKNKFNLHDSGDDSEDGYDDSGDEDGGDSKDEYDDDFGRVDMSEVDPSLRAILDAIEDESDRQGLYEDIMEEAETRGALNPDLWYRYSYWELHAYFSCARVMAGSRPVYDSEKWTDLRQYYHQFAVEDKVETPIPEGAQERSYQFNTDAFDPPLVPFQTSWKGRGLKAARNIMKGELVFKATNNTIVFTHGHTWRKFLFAINERYDDPYDDETTCDVLVWSWVQTVEEDGPMVIVMDLDNGSLLNEGRDSPGWEPPNVRCGQPGDKICIMEYYATKDIMEGDELLCDYRGFAMLDSWREMGL